MPHMMPYVIINIIFVISTKDFCVKETCPLATQGILP